MSRSNRSLRRKPLSLLIHTSLPLLLCPALGYSATVVSAADSGPGTLREAIANAASGDIIDFDCVALSCPATIMLVSQGNNQGFPGPTAFSISGKSITIDGAGGITLQAQPGVTSATSLRHFFVDTGAALTLENLALSGGHAIGGNGGAVSSGGGGGGAGLGGSIFNQGSLTLRAVVIGSNSATGGSGGPSSVCSPGSGGGGMGGDGGGDGCLGGYFGGGGGGGTGGNGGDSSSNHGGNGGPGLGGAGGGGGGVYHSWLAGSGSNGGGGGGSDGHEYADGGNGSDGGGGGGVSWGYAGNGGFGGGGGGAQYNYYGAAHSGAGGFGGGLGGIRTAGQGGSGFGGAIFARSGGFLVFEDAGDLSYIVGNSVGGGTGNGSGNALGAGIFLQGNAGVAFHFAGGTASVPDTITGDCAEGITPNCSDGGLSMTGSGILVLGATDNYNGPTTISGGVMQLDGALTKSAMTINGGTLAGGGNVNIVTLDGGGVIAPGNPLGSVATMTIRNVTWNAGTIELQLGDGSPGSSDAIIGRSGAPAASDGIIKGSAGVWRFRLLAANSLPLAQPYDLIQCAAPCTFAGADFSLDGHSIVDGTFAVATAANISTVRFTVTNVVADRIFRDDLE